MMKSRLDIAFGAILNQEIITRRRSNDDDANMPRVVPVTHVMTGVSLIYCIAKCLADLTTSAVISGPASLDKSAKREPPCGNMRIMVDSIGVCYNIRFECQRVVKRMIIRSHPQTTCMSGLGLHHTIWPILPCSRHVFPFG